MQKLEELKEQCKRQEIPESKVKEFQGKDRMIGMVDGKMVVRTNELDDQGICRIMYIM